MTTLKLRTNLRCSACVQSITPLLDAEPGITHWQADVTTPAKLLTVEGNTITRGRVAELLRQKGYEVLGDAPTTPLPTVATPNAPATPAGATPQPPTSYFPILLILAYLVAGVAALEYAAGAFELTRAMDRFMAGFFLVFSFFKLLDVPSFAGAFRMYDLVAKSVPGYAWLYPFLELALGLAYLARVTPLLTNSVTLVVMTLGALGVVQSLRSKRPIRCACLGAVFNLPMSYVTLTEDLLMALMAAAMLALLLTQGH